MCLRYIRNVALAIFSILSVSCNGSKSLGGNYFIGNISRDHVDIWKKLKDRNTVVVDELVVDYKIKNQFVFVLRKKAYSPTCYDKDKLATIITHYTDEEEYWIIDVDNENEIGPLSIEMYNNVLDRMKINYVKLSTPKNYSSNTNTFNEAIMNCVRLQYGYNYGASGNSKINQ